LLDETFVPGDVILTHSGFAVERMTAEDAADALAVFAEKPHDTAAEEPLA
jgi:hydrogenase expression/formation protein HypC